MKVNGRGLLIILMIVIHLPAKGQADTAKVQKQGTMDFEFLNEKFKERKSMLYVGGSGTIDLINWVSNIDNGLQLGYETKISKTQALGFSAGFYLVNSEGDIGPGTIARVGISYKWYYNLNYRMERGKTGNNFSANYFFISPNLSLSNMHYSLKGYSWDFTRGMWAAKYERGNAVWPQLKLGYGIQRAVQGRIHFDLQLGLMYSRTTYIPQLSDFLFGQITVGFIIK